MFKGTRQARTALDPVWEEDFLHREKVTVFRPGYTPSRYGRFVSVLLDEDAAVRAYCTACFVAVPSVGAALIVPFDPAKLVLVFVGSMALLSTIARHAAGFRFLKRAIKNGNAHTIDVEVDQHVETAVKYLKSVEGSLGDLQSDLAGETRQRVNTLYWQLACLFREREKLNSLRETLDSGAYEDQRSLRLAANRVRDEITAVGDEAYRLDQAVTGAVRAEGVAQSKVSALAAAIDQMDSTVTRSMMARKDSDLIPLLSAYTMTLNELTTDMSLPDYAVSNGWTANDWNDDDRRLLAYYEQAKRGEKQ